jgi:riboflavin kinase / FMN adenylyltransferase
MKILQGIRQLPKPMMKSVLTIGNFDGVHLGHRALIDEVLKRSRASRIPSVVMTFDPHPMKVLHPDRHLKRLFSVEDQQHQFEKLGVDVLVVEPFSREFSQLSPSQYIDEWIVNPFHPELLVVGHDFNFGANRAGTLSFLGDRAGELGFELLVLPPVSIDGVVVSSSKVREAVCKGDVAQAAKLLGRNFYLEGIIEKGAGRGRTIGVPTANLRTPAELVPALGVYAAVAELNGKRYGAAVNIGHNPTFQTEGQVSIEAHLLDFSSDIYGVPMKLEFVQRIRDEQKFANVEALTSQIKNDIEKSKQIISQLVKGS